MQSSLRTPTVFTSVRSPPLHAVTVTEGGSVTVRHQETSSKKLLMIHRTQCGRNSVSLTVTVNTTRTEEQGERAGGLL